MISTHYDYKNAFLQSVFKEIEKDTVNVLDMGSGTSRDFVDILNKYPNIHYTAVEIDEISLEIAKQNLDGFDNVTFLNDFGENIKAKYENHFDITISLSVLEHVKYMNDFLETSVHVTKQGGQVIHRYDLGHSLYPSSLRERIKVSICKNYPFLIPSRNFTTHPDLKKVIEVLNKFGLTINDVQYSQIPGLKSIMNKINWQDSVNSKEIANKIVELDTTLLNYLQQNLPNNEMEKLFPTITLYGIKN